MQLKANTTLQGGKYKIECVLGQGGFGITYLAFQTGLHRRVAVKEFFMKDLCNRDEDTGFVSVPSTGSRELVNRFRQKFLKEAQTIAAFDHPSIVRIHDIFEENGTAYYVMEYIDGGSLSDQPMPMSETCAVAYIRQVAVALSYVHSNKTLHLDVKPSNILLRRNGDAVLVDFGISKHYDDAGSQTSSTPAGISKGYAPIEQYSQGVPTFSPATDVYSLGATLYKLVTGQTPPEASELIVNKGLPTRPQNVSTDIWNAITRAMQPAREDRPQTVGEFLQMLNNEEIRPVEEETVVADTVKRSVETTTPKSTIHPQKETKPKKSNAWMLIVAGIVVIAGVVVVAIRGRNEPGLQPTPTEEIAESDDVLTRLFNDMVYVEGGTFTMGATAEQGGYAGDWEKPHQVTLSSFYICKHEVTQEEWEAVMGSNPSNWKGKRLPVETVLWDECQTFISKLNSLTGKHYRLPTEAEWEYAARGGSRSQGYKYSGSNILDNVAWYKDNSGSMTHEVMTKLPNELGLYDMSCNVWEWCNPNGASSGSNRVGRGGSWYSYARYCRVSCRNNFAPSYRSIILGLRLAL